MALTRGRPVNLPGDAVMLTEEEALKYQFKLMKSWRHKSDTFAFQYGGTILGCLSSVAAIYINNHYRMKFKLLMHGRLSSYLPICIVPSLLSILLHTQFVVTDVALQKSCVVCTELRSSAIQAITGCVFPAILAPLSAFPLAVQYNTYNVPYITKEPMKVLRLWQKQTKPIASTLFVIFLCQALAGSIVTYFETKSVLNVAGKIAKLEQDLEHPEQL